jgi:hypothetical protein
MFMKKLHLRSLASIVLLSAAASAQAEIMVNESFVGYSSVSNFAGQATTGAGLTGNWGGSQYYRTQDTGLTMAGVYSDGGSLYYPTSTAAGNGGRTAFATVANPLSEAVTYFGSYLFTFFSNGAQPRTVGGIGLGESTDNDNAASFVWAGNGYNTQADPVVEGPGIRTEGSAWQVPGISLSIGTTYIMLFQFNASLGTTSAWVLNAAQLANFSGSLNAETLNAAISFTEAPTGVAWGATLTSVNPIGSLSNLMMFGNLSTDLSFLYIWDEIRISNTDLTEAVTNAAVPEPSTIATLGLGLGALAIARTLRRRRVS